MKFILHHVGVTCSDIYRNLNWYGTILQNNVRTPWPVQPEAGTAFVGRGSDVMIELVGAPYEPYGHRRHLSTAGPTLSHLGFWVDDLSQAFELLRNEGLCIVWEPKDSCDIKHFAGLDPNGVLLEFFNCIGGNPFPKPEPMDPIRLHHVSLLTKDLRQTERFFARNLHMKTVIEHTENDGGFLFMVDESFAYWTHNFMLEVIGPPRKKVGTATALLEPREQEIIETHGPCLDHICYVADDVPSAHKQLISRGAVSVAEPYRDYGSWISWLRDPDQNDIELLTPIPESIINLILRQKEPFQTMGVAFDAGRKITGELAAPPWRNQQLENLRKQR